MKTDPVFLVGPTAVGKTRIAISLAGCLGGEIISADSMQIYRGMDIGTAKPSPDEMAIVPHHLIDIMSLDETFSAMQFKRLAEKTIEDIRSRNSVPVITGGTGLYIKTLTEGIFEGPSADWNIRQELRQLEERDGPGTLYNELSRHDAESARRIQPNDMRRIIRAIEVFRLTDKPISEHQKEWSRLKKDVTILGLEMSREILYERINERVDIMFRNGLVVETKRLMDEGILNNHTAMQAIGYKEVTGYIRGEHSLERAVELLKRNTRRFAKRQLTWFRKDERITWFNINASDMDITVSEMIRHLIRRGYQNLKKIQGDA